MFDFAMASVDSFFIMLQRICPVIGHWLAQYYAIVQYAVSSSVFCFCGIHGK